MKNPERNKIITSNIKRLIRDARINQVILAKEVGIAPSTLNGYLQGHKNPSDHVLGKIANYFNVHKSSIDTTYQDGETNEISKIYKQLESDRKELVYNFAKDQLNQQINSEDAPETSVKPSNLVPVDFSSEIATEFTKQPETANSPRNIIPIPMRKVNYTNTAVCAGNGLYLEEADFIQTELPKWEVSEGADFGVRVNGDSMEPTYPDGCIVWVKQTPYVDPRQVGIFLVDGEAVLKELGDGILISHNESYSVIDLKNVEHVHCFGRALGYTTEI